MLEELCSATLWNACCAIRDGTPMVRLRGITSADIAAEIGCTAQNARVQMNKPGTEWNIGQLLRYCDVLEIPYSEALEAAIK